MSKTEVKRIVKNYAKALRKAHLPFKAIYLFGSYVKGRPNHWSDIDVAVVSDRFKSNTDRYRRLLWQIRMDVDNRIEPHGFTIKDFANDEDPMAYEIKRSGVRIQ